MIGPFQAHSWVLTLTQCCWLCSNANQGVNTLHTPLTHHTAWHTPATLMTPPQEQQLQHEDSQFAASPFDYLSALQQRHLAATARSEARKRRRLGHTGAHELEGLAAGEEGAGLVPGSKGRRRDEKHRWEKEVSSPACLVSQHAQCVLCSKRGVNAGF